MLAGALCLEITKEIRELLVIAFQRQPVGTPHAQELLARGGRRLSSRVEPPGRLSNSGVDKMPMRWFDGRHMPPCSCAYHAWPACRGERRLAVFFPYASSHPKSQST